MNSIWESMGRRFGAAGRIGLLAGATFIVLATAVAGYWLLRTDYQVLFADLAPQDAAAMTAELDRLKVPYVLGGPIDSAAGDGATILVDRNEVYRTRIKLMGKDIPLHGAVGFELFNNSDLGMTEFAQKINYQRALQGEITRTILGLKEIRDARVLLVLPEQGLFKQVGNKPKASITLTMKPAQSLRGEQVAGIQRLVSAAVSGIQTQDVTIVDQEGIALTRSGGDGTTDADAGSGTARLDLKRDMEVYLSRKATTVLERALGTGQASASVDVTLNMDRVQSSTDEPVSAGAGRPGAAPTGVITREKSAVRESGGSGLQNATSAGVAAPVAESNQREVEYALGHHVEHIVSQPGSVRRIQVAVVVRKGLSSAQQESLRHMVAAAVGASFDRGDAVVIQTTAAFDALNDRPLAANSGDAGERQEIDVPAASAVPARHARPRSAAPAADVSWTNVVAPLAIAALAAACLLAWFVMRLRAAPLPATPRALSAPERQEILKRLQHWMGEIDTPPAMLTTAPTATGTPGVRP